MKTLFIFVLNKPSSEYIYFIRLERKGESRMTIDERKSSMMSTNVIQNLILENRGKLNISGVLDVLSFDDQIVIVETELRIINS